jgi:hypothetical protein
MSFSIVILPSSNHTTARLMILLYFLLINLSKGSLATYSEFVIIQVCSQPLTQSAKITFKIRALFFIIAHWCWVILSLAIVIPRKRILTKICSSFFILISAVTFCDDRSSEYLASPLYIMYRFYCCSDLLLFYLILNTWLER